MVFCQAAEESSTSRTTSAGIGRARKSRRPQRRPPPAKTRQKPPKARRGSQKGRLGDLLTHAQGESVKTRSRPISARWNFRINRRRHFAGMYKGKSAENLERVILYNMEVGIKHDVKVTPIPPKPPRPIATRIVADEPCRDEY